MKGKQTKFKSFLIVVALSPIATDPAQAGLNLKTGSFEWSKTIPLSVNQKKPFEFELGYNSRRVFRGLFGQGWCSDLDIQFHKTNDQRQFVHLCGDVIEVTKTTEQPTFTDTKSTTWMFDTTGRPVSVSKKGVVISVDWSTSIVRLKNQTTIARFTLGHYGSFVSHIEFSENQNLVLKYQGDHLVELIGKFNERFDYDDWNNLTEIKVDKIQKYKILYDLSLDRVSQFELGPCSVKLKYQNTENTRSVTSTQICASTPVFIKTYSI